jgi:hypothetical protein
MILRIPGKCGMVEELKKNFKIMNTRMTKELEEGGEVGILKDLGKMNMRFT